MQRYFKYPEQYPNNTRDIDLVLHRADKKDPKHLAVKLGESDAIEGGYVYQYLHPDLKESKFHTGIADVFPPEYFGIYSDYVKWDDKCLPHMCATYQTVWEEAKEFNQTHKGLVSIQEGLNTISHAFVFMFQDSPVTRRCGAMTKLSNRKYGIIHDFEVSGSFDPSDVVFVDPVIHIGAVSIYGIPDHFTVTSINEEAGTFNATSTRADWVQIEDCPLYMIECYIPF